MTNSTLASQSTDLKEALSRLESSTAILEKHWKGERNKFEYTLLNDLNQAREIVRHASEAQPAASVPGRNTMGQSAKKLGLSLSSVINYCMYGLTLPKHLDEQGDLYLTDEEIQAYRDDHQQDRRGRKKGA